MFDIGWSEMALILLVALIVIGPKDLPRVARTVGQWVAKGRGMAREFQRALEDMAREAELDKVKSEIEKAGRTDIGRTIEKTIDPSGELSKALDPRAHMAATSAKPAPAAAAPAGPTAPAVAAPAAAVPAAPAGNGGVAPAAQKAAPAGEKAAPAARKAAPAAARKAVRAARKEAAAAPPPAAPAKRSRRAPAANGAGGGEEAAKPARAPAPVETS
jgi:sec-independent protein translocase protein TatB